MSREAAEAYGFLVARIEAIAAGCSDMYLEMPHTEVGKAALAVSKALLTAIEDSRR